MGEVYRVARFGPMAWIWTIGYLAVALYFAWSTLSGASTTQYDWAIALLLYLVILYALLRSVRRYRIDGAHLFIDRRVPSKVAIPLENITNVEALPPGISFFNPRILSTGGLFGWAGKAQVRKAGDLRSLEADVYGTNPSNVVVVGANNEQTYVLTPADPKGFASALRASVAATKRASAPVAQAAPSARSMRRGKKARRS